MRIPIRSALVPVFVSFFLFVFASSAAAAVEAPGWTLDSVASPTNFSAHDNAECLAAVAREELEPLCDAYQVDVMNVGAKETNGSPVTLTDTLPAGVTVQKIDLFSRPPGENEGPDLASEAGCAVTIRVVRCELPSGRDVAADCVPHRE
jgi:hypothetical protein